MQSRPIFISWMLCTTDEEFIILILVTMIYIGRMNKLIYFNKFGLHNIEQILIKGKFSVLFKVFPNRKRIKNQVEPKHTIKARMAHKLWQENSPHQYSSCHGLYCVYNACSHFMIMCNSTLAASLFSVPLPLIISVIYCNHVLRVEPPLWRNLKVDIHPSSSSFSFLKSPSSFISSSDASSVFDKILKQKTR